MSTVSPSLPPRNRTYYAHLAGVPGFLLQRAGAVCFLDPATGTLQVLADCTGLLVLGECTLADAQQLQDLLAGGAARIACTRDEGRQ